MAPTECLEQWGFERTWETSTDWYVESRDAYFPQENS